MSGFRLLWSFATAIILLFSSGASAATIGNPVIPRGLFDRNNDFVLGFTDIVFETGVVTDWSVFIRRFEGGDDGTIGLLALKPVSGGDFRVQALDLETARWGKNSFSSNLAVKKGWILGLYLTDAKVAYSSRARKDMSSARSYSSIAVGDRISVTEVSGRRYSVSAHIDPDVAPVPLPATFPLVAAALAALGFLSRRARKTGSRLRGM